MKILCTKCIKYHPIKERCKKIIIECKKCKHKQETKQKEIRNIKCSVCNRKKMYS